MAEPGFWDDNNAAQKLIDENNQLKAKYDRFNELNSLQEDVATLVDLYEEEPDDDIAEELTSQLTQLQNNVDQYQLSLLLSGPYDHNNAILEIHPGAGGN